MKYSWRFVVAAGFFVTALVVPRTASNCFWNSGSSAGR
jgi:hypothetical protein